MSGRYVIAVIGGATAGAEAAGMLAEHGVTVVVFEQNARPYGKIEDGLPRWHVKLRQKEYETVNHRLDRPEVHFVPLTKIGRDIDFRALVTEWGFTAVILALGAWRDRPFPVEGADRYIGRGLIYQNPFIYWFNHLFCEADYTGPQCQVADGAIVVGGGLASLDVMKVLQIETVRLALERRGICEDALRLEATGIPDMLAAHGLSWDTLGLKAATLFYRRRIEDMPLTGKGNILLSRKHSIQVGTHVIEQFLGLSEDQHEGEEAALDSIAGSANDSVQRIAEWVRSRPLLDGDKVEAILRRVRARQQAVGYSGSYREWITRHAPAEVTP